MIQISGTMFLFKEPSNISRSYQWSVLSIFRQDPFWRKTSFSLLLYSNQISVSVPTVSGSGQHTYHTHSYSCLLGEWGGGEGGVCMCVWMGRLCASRVSYPVHSTWLLTITSHRYFVVWHPKISEEGKILFAAAWIVQIQQSTIL